MEFIKTIKLTEEEWNKLVGAVDIIDKINKKTEDGICYITDLVCLINSLEVLNYKIEVDWETKAVETKEEEEEEENNSNIEIKETKEEKNGFMTCKEYIEKYNPSMINDCYYGGISGCPYNYGFVYPIANCDGYCDNCWGSKAVMDDEYNWDAFKNGDFVVNIRTVEEIKKFFDIAKEQGIKVLQDIDKMVDMYPYISDGICCFRIEDGLMNFSDMGWYKNKYKIIAWRF